MDQENKKPEPPKNLLEKLIRLDKKNSNFNMQDFEMKKKLKIRNNPNIKTPFFSSSLHDHGLKHFWKHVCNYYFRKINLNEIERLDYLEMMLSKHLKGIISFFFKSEDDFKNINKKYIKILKKN